MSKKWLSVNDINNIDNKKCVFIIKSLLKRLRENEEHDIRELLYIFRIKALIKLFLIKNTEISKWKNFLDLDVEKHDGWCQYNSSAHEEIIMGFKTVIFEVEKFNYDLAKEKFSQTDLKFAKLRKYESEIETAIQNINK